MWPQGTDMKLLRGVLRRALGSVAGLPRAAMHAVRNLGRKREPTDGLSTREQAAVDQGADRIEGVLQDPEIQAFPQAFDARFEEHLRALAARDVSAG